MFVRNAILCIVILTAAGLAGCQCAKTSSSPAKSAAPAPAAPASASSLSATSKLTPKTDQPKAPDAVYATPPAIVAQEHGQDPQRKLPPPFVND